MARKRYSDEDALKILLIWSLWLTQTDLRPKKRGPYKPRKKDISN
jgi:hypothetical protein